MRLYKYLTEETNEIAYITRSCVGSWSISLKKKGNYIMRSIESYEQFPDKDVREVIALGYVVFDFKDIPNDKFRPLLHEMEALSAKLCR